MLSSGNTRPATLNWARGFEVKNINNLTNNAMTTTKKNKIDKVIHLLNIKAELLSHLTPDEYFAYVAKDDQRRKTKIDLQSKREELFCGILKNKSHG